MGWASGSEIAIPTIKAIQKHVKDSESRKAIYREFLKAMTDNDWDTLDEAEGIDAIFDELVKEYYA